MATLTKARLLAAILVAGTAFAGSPALARDVYHPFVKDQFYLARGGTPATFAQVADDPLSVFRSQAAYDTFRQHVSGYLGRTLDDAQFRALLRSDAVRLVPCVGRINTAGVTDSGRIGQRERACYTGEMNIELRLDDGRWVIVGSQACWNTVYGQIPYMPYSPPVTTAPPPPPVMMAPPPQPTTIIWQTPDTFISGTVVTIGCTCCGQQSVIGTPSIFVPGSVSQTTTFGF